MPYAERIKTERNGPVTTVIIDRPEARNACSVDMVRALHRAFTDFEADPESRVAVLTGDGGAFCSGADLREIESGVAIGFCWAGVDEGVTRRYLGAHVIAAVTGPALAAGLALAVWCDLRVADATASFGVSCRRFGGPMPNGATVRLPRLIGQSHALDLMLTGRIIGATEAYRIGLVNRLVDVNARAAARHSPTNWRPCRPPPCWPTALVATPMEPSRRGRHPIRGRAGQGRVRRRLPVRRGEVRRGRGTPRERNRMNATPVFLYPRE